MITSCKIIYFVITILLGNNLQILNKEFEIRDKYDRNIFRVVEPYEFYLSKTHGFT